MFSLSVRFCTSWRASVVRCMCRFLSTDQDFLKMPFTFYGKFLPQFFCFFVFLPTVEACSETLALFYFRDFDKAPDHFIYTRIVVFIFYFES